jgi:hypothetical protein
MNPKSAGVRTPDDLKDNYHLEAEQEKVVVSNCQLLRFKVNLSRDGRL